jgi:hypothetical protein
VNAETGKPLPLQDRAAGLAVRVEIPAHDLRLINVGAT